MSEVRLALLNASHNDVDTARNFRREIDAPLVEYDVTSGQLPRNPDIDGCVVTGSRSSVYWDEDWIQPLKDWLQGAIDRGLPMLGVCYGHQLLADVLGGTVTDMGEYELGYREVTHNGSSRLFSGIDETFVTFTTHSDRVSELPPEATEIAANDYGNHGFRKDRVFGVQFHPEYDHRTAERITREKDLPQDRIDAVLDGITAERVAAADQVKQLFENFEAFVAAINDPVPAAD